MTDKQISKFINKLQVSFPIQKKINLDITLSDQGVSRGAANLYGMVREVKGSNQVSMLIDSGRPVELVYKTIAHEYRHIMQWYNKDLVMLTTRSGKTDKEVDAQLFGAMVLREFVGNC